MQELHGERYIYNLLTRIFSVEPTMELLRELSKIKLPEENRSEGMCRMVEAVRLHNVEFEELQERLSIEFTRLFLGPIKPVAIPYASWYLSEAHQLMTEETIDIRRRYLEAGMAVKDLYSTPDDHIGIELEFLSCMTGEIISAHEDGRKERVRELELARSEFIKDHLQQWVPAFVAAIVDSDADEFYKGAALLLDEVFMIA
jgi:putative dimethyl sulfoxide reductase chaperone